MNTNSESCVTTIDRSQDGRLVVAGFGDGHIKLFDIRASANEWLPFLDFRHRFPNDNFFRYSTINAGSGDAGWIHKVAFSDATNQVYSIGIYGELMTWSLKRRNIPKMGNTPSRRPNHARKETDSDNVVIKAQNREGLLKDQFTADSKVTLVKSHSHSLKVQPVHCADLRVSPWNGFRTSI